MMSGRDLCAKTRYRIWVEGELDQRWSAWFGGIIIESHPSGVTSLTAHLDQSGLHSVLAKIRDLNLLLLSLEQVKAA
jgi:hypothetical protein